ncbi:rhamnogalacturonan acetylesterase [Sphingobacterium bovistauri]|uniref:Rhamnogalacturonan acetylesterase n=1 Tax=Sphingobacterium bovistauri TaxID=2781959 RepID=A0ABS7Z342_9SPHI|nr:rhamnogalacturonan acetylesterase [Sphingobacterium bovistauri]MCA5004007.1 rhamnogalacturonan acetylesterase [Sphingobacterium bovistauri]
MRNSFYVATAFLLAFVLLSFNQFQKINVWMIGDSTMAIKSLNKYPETGWGVAFATMFTEKVEVHNHARNGRSTKSFKNEGLWKAVYDNIKQGDYVFIQFGHNDEKVDKEGVGSNPVQFEANLREYVELVKAKKAKPILLTPIARRKFENGVLIETHGDYGNIACQLAKKMKVPCIDMRSITNSLLSEMGEEKSKSLFLHLDKGHKNYPNGVSDNTHLNEYGASTLSKLVVKELERQKIPLKRYLK